MDNFIESIIDWSKFDANVDISIRISGVTKELIEQEVQLWQKQIEFLTPLDFAKIKKEINGWDISIPDISNFEVVASTYTKLVSYKVRISQLLAETNAWSDTCETAIKYLEDLSAGAYSGTANDKKSNAKHVVQPFVHLKNQVARLQNYLDKMHSSILFCAQQLDLLIKEKQSRAKLNHRLGHEGEEHLIGGSASILSKNEDEDGYVFNLSKKKV